MKVSTPRWGARCQGEPEMTLCILFAHKKVGHRPAELLPNQHGHIRRAAPLIIELAPQDIPSTPTLRVPGSYLVQATTVVLSELAPRAANTGVWQSDATSSKPLSAPAG